YWMADSYQERFLAGQRHESFDKDFVRSWVSERCDPYKDEIPVIPDSLIEATAGVYRTAYETITGHAFTPDAGGVPVLDRVRNNLEPYFVLKCPTRDERKAARNAARDARRRKRARTSWRPRRRCFVNAASPSPRLPTSSMSLQCRRPMSSSIFS